MLYPIVTLYPDDEPGPWIGWYTCKADADRCVFAISAQREGVWIGSANLDDSWELVDFQTALSEAWDAVTAIRHGTSLERFPRDLTTVSGPHGDPTAEHEWCPKCEPTEADR